MGYCNIHYTSTPCLSCEMERQTETINNEMSHQASRIVKALEYLMTTVVGFCFGITLAGILIGMAMGG